MPIVHRSDQLLRRLAALQRAVPAVTGAALITGDGSGRRWATVPRMLVEPPAPEPPETAFRIANLEVRPAELQVLVDDRRAGFTVREFELFFLLSRRIDSVVQRPEIYTAMWGGEMPRRNRSVDVLVAKFKPSWK